MKILFSSHFFYPNVGGLETVSLLLATEFTRAGHRLRLITQTPATEPKVDFPFEVFRRPSPAEILRLTQWADVVFHNNISLKTALPLLVVRRPWVVAHQNFIPHDCGLRAMKGRLKHWALRGASNIAISKAVASDFSTPCTVIPNPYNDKVFRLMPGIRRDKDLVFVGRLVSDKGTDLLIRALALLKAKGLAPRLTVVGGGPEEKKIKKLVYELGIDRQVDFVGVKRGQELASVLNGHRILVVPSLWQEPFGVVALEGIACGCVVLGSEGGGLKDAIGLCGCTFPNGDVEALSARITELLTHPELARNYYHYGRSHLNRHLPQAVASAYLQVFVVATECFK